MNEDRDRLEDPLAKATQQLRTVFARYPARRPVPGCSHCVTSADQEALAAGYLAKFAYKALNTWGDEPDFKHFLPRLLALHLDVTLDKLPYAQWRQWPPDERQAIEGYLAALWEQRLLIWDDDQGAIDLLRAMARIELDPRLLQARWRQLVSGPALRQVTRLINADGIYQLPAAQDRASRMLLAWLLDPATAALLEEAFFAAEGREAGALAGAIDRLALLAEIGGRQAINHGGDQ